MVKLAQNNSRKLYRINKKKKHNNGKNIQDREINGK